MNPTQPAQSSVSYWLPLLSAVLGYILGGLSEWLRDRRAHKREREAQELTANREREARESLRRDQLRERRNNFQRETLLELQTEAAKLMRATGEGHHKDVMARRAGGEWQKQLYGEELNMRLNHGMVKTTTLGVRVRDEMVRKILDEFKQLCAGATRSRSEADSERSIFLASQTYDCLNKRIGELLRQLDDDEAEILVQA